MTTLSEWLDTHPLESDEEREDREGALPSPIHRNLTQEVQTPDEAAVDAQIGEIVRQPRQAVTTYRDVFSRAAEAQRIEQQTETSPRLRRWLENQNNIAVARDDVETLSIFERLARDPTAQQIALQAGVLFSPGLVLEPLRRGGIDPRPQFRQGQLDVELGKLGYRSYQAQRGRGPALTAEEQARLDELQAREGGDDWGPFILGPTARLAPQVLGSLERAGRQAARRTDEAFSGSYGNEAERREIARKVLAGDAGEAGRAALVAPIAGVSSAIGGFGGFAGGYLSFGNEQETGQAYVEFLRAGADPDAAARQAEAYGAWATALEFVGDALGLRLSGLGRLGARAIAGRGIVRPGAAPAYRRALADVAATSVDQGVEEASQQLAQIIHQDLAQQETERGAGEGDAATAWSKVFTPEAIEQILRAGYIGAQGGIGFAAIPSSVNLGLDLREVAAADRNAALFEQQTEAARKSALGQRLPSALEGAVNEMDPSEVFIDADRFVEHFQSAGADPFTVADQLGIGAERLEQALAAHAQVSMPSGTFAARVLRVPAHASLQNFARRSPNEATPAEREAQIEVIRKRVEDIANEAQIAQSDDEIGAVVEARVRELLDQAYREGGTSPQVNARYAKMYGALARAIQALSRKGQGDYAQRTEKFLRTLFGEGFNVRGPAQEDEAAPALKGAQPMRPEPTPRERFDAILAEEEAADAQELEQADFDESERVRSAAERAGEAMREIQERTLERGAPADARRQFSTGRTEPPAQLPEPETPEWEAATQQALATPHTERTPVQRALVRFAREEEARARQAEAGNVGPADSVLRGVMNEEGGELDQAALAPEDVVSEPIPGEAKTARRYGFAVGNEHVIVQIAPEPENGHAAAVDWTFLGRLRRHERMYERGAEKFGLSGLKAIFDGVADILLQDMADMQRGAYVFTPQTEAHRRAYLAFLGRRPLPEGYHIKDVPEEDSIYILRDDVDVSPNGEILYLGNLPSDTFEKERASDKQLAARDNAFYEKVEALRPARVSDRGGGQRTGGSVGEGGPGTEGGELFQTQRELDALGFMSVALEAAKALPDRAMRGEEALNRIAKARGVTGFTGRVADEMKFLGLDEFRSRKSVTKEELLYHIRANRLVLNEAFNRFDPRAQTRREPMTLEEYVDPRNRDAIEQADYEEEMFDVLAPEDMGFNFAGPRTAEQIRSFQEAGIRRGPGDLRLPGDEPVFELRLKIPEFSGETEQRQAALLRELAENADKPPSKELTERSAQIYEELRNLPKMPGSDFQSHWSRPPSNDLGVLVSVRGEERIDDKGQRTLFGGEVQSDLGQQARAVKDTIETLQKVLADNPSTQFFESGTFKPLTADEAAQQPHSNTRAELEARLQQWRSSEFVRAPLASKTSAWTGAAVRAIIYRAARDGFDSVSFPTGETSKLIQGNDSAASHYDTNVLGAVKKVAHAMGGEVREGSVQFGRTDRNATNDPGAPFAIWDTQGPAYGQNFATREEAAATLRDIQGRGRLRDGYVRGPEERSQASAYVLDLTPQMKERVLKEGMPLFQSRSQEGKRGSILLDRFATDGSLRQATINLFEASDLSTFLHESGHLFLEILQAVSLDEQAPQELKDMWASTQNWFGLQPGQWESMTLEQRRDYHELWARTFEAYLMEGKAPSLGLREAFAAFKAWLLQIYRSVMRLDANLNPQIRDVFDRLLATEQEMAEARAAAGVDRPIFATREESGLSEAAWADYQNAIAGAREAQEAELRARVMETYTRKQKRWWRSERARIRPAIEREVDSDPARRAHDWLAFGEWRDLPQETDEDGNVVAPTGEEAKPEDLPPMKLSAQALVDDYGENILNELPPALRPARPEDIERVLADAMALKKQGKRKTALRLGAWVRAQGGIKDTGGEIRQALGDPRARPGLINNESGLDPDALAERAFEAGYFGVKPAKGGRLFQEGDDSNVIPFPRRTEQTASREATQKPIRTSYEAAITDQTLREFVEKNKGMLGRPADLVREYLDDHGNRTAAVEAMRAQIEWLGSRSTAQNPKSSSYGARQREIANHERALEILEGRGLQVVGPQELSQDELFAGPERIGRGRSKSVFADPNDPRSVFVEMRPDMVTGAFLDFARQAHAEGAPYAKHLPNPGEAASMESGIRFSTERLEENQTRARVGVENGRFFITGLAENDPQRKSILQAMDALRAYLRETLPADAPRYFFDLGPQNFMRRSNGTLVINDPVELAQDELFAGPERPTLEEFIKTLISDIKGERAVYSVDDEAAVEQNQRRDDMRRWFESRGIDLTKNKDEIREQIAAALDREAESGDSVSADLAATWFGFSSGDELIQALRGLKPRAQAIEEGIDARLEAEYGDPLRDGTIAEAARAAANTEAQARVLELEFAAIQQAAGGRVTPANRAARQFAERAVNNMSVREVRSYDKFLAGERRAARNAMEALAKGDHAQASLHKSRQLASFWMYRLARAAADEADRIRRYLRKFDNEGTRKAFLPGGGRHLDQIDQVLEAVDLRAKPYPGARARASFRDYLTELENEGIDVDDIVEMDPAFLEAIRRRPFNSLSMEEVRGLRDVVSNFDQLGRRWNKVLTDRKNRQLNEVIEGLVVQAEQEYPKRAHIVRSLASRSRFERAVDLVMDIHGSMVKAEQLFRFMDGLKANGPWFSAFIPAAQRAESAKTERLVTETQRFKDILSVYSKKELGRMLLKKEFIPEIADNLTKLQQIGVALNVGNAYNREHMMEGFNWSEDQLQAVLRRLDQRDWNFVQSVWDFLESFKAESFALDERVRGVRPEEVEPLPVQTRFGTFRGGYFPVKFDATRSRRAAKREAKEAVEQISGGSYRQIGTKRGRLKQRRGTAGQAFRLDPISVISEHVEETVHDLTHRELIIDARRLIASERVAAAVSGVLGPWGVKVLDNWVSKVEQPQPRVMDSWERVVAKVRNNATVVSMGIKITTALIQELGALNAIPRTGILPMLKQKGITIARDYPEFLARQTARLFGAPETLPARFQFIFDRSDFMKHRMANFDRDVRDAMATKLGERPGILPQVPKAAQDKMMILSQLMDMAVAGPAWLAGYETALAGKVPGIEQGDEAAAVEHADSIVRTTQSGGAPKDLASILANDNQFWRLATLFMSWANSFYNQMFVEQIPGVLAGKISPARFAANMAFVWFLPALATMWFYGRLEPQDDEDDEERNTRVALEVALYPLQGIPIVRDALNAAVTGYDYKATPAQAAIEAPIKLTQAAQRGDSEEVVKQALMSAGYAAGLPSRQMWITGEALTDIATGEEDVTEDPLDSARELLIQDTR
jgi:hypothetical protein